MCDAPRSVGYARVSTEEQNLDLQLAALQSAGCDAIYTDHISGGLHSRPGLNEAMASLRKGDKLIVWRLDRLGRSLTHLVQLLEQLGARQIKFCSLCEHIDTVSSGGRLLFHMMAALAEFERCLISERTRAGMAAAKSMGKRMGRQPSMSEEQRQLAFKLIQQGGSVASVAQRFDVTPRTVYRMLHRMRPAPPLAEHTEIATNEQSDRMPR